MSVSTQFYLDQAAKCAQGAIDAKLSNQRETFLRSQEAWQAMAERAIRVDAERAKRDAARGEAVTANGTGAISAPQ